MTPERVSTAVATGPVKLFYGIGATSDFGGNSHIEPFLGVFALEAEMVAWMHERMAEKYPAPKYGRVTVRAFEVDPALMRRVLAGKDGAA